MKILSGTGDYKKVKTELKIYAYVKDRKEDVLKLLDKDAARLMNKPLKNILNGIRFIDEEGIWYAFLQLPETKKINTESFRRLGGDITKEIKHTRADDIAVVIPGIENLTADAAVHGVVEGIVLGEYTYEELKTVKEDDKPKKDYTIHLYSAGKKEILQKNIDRTFKIASATNEARKLADTPSNMMTPKLFTDIVVQKAKKEGLKVTVLDEKILTKNGWNALVGVSKGSYEPPRVVIVEYNGGKSGGQRYVVVGKGVTFDSGGISIKPSSGMEEMKFDMAGAAAAVMIPILSKRLGLPVNVIAIAPLAENMPGGKAQKPGDVVKTLSGKTVEIISTDAEGRMILADALYYAVDRYKPKYLIDLATLTGACVVALGSEASGIMGNDDELVKMLIKAGEKSGDRLWELPLWDVYKDLLKSDVADMKNSGSRWGGAIQGGIFLKEFINDTRWAHVDIAGTAYLDRSKPYFTKGATGAGVRLLISFIEGLK